MKLASISMILIILTLMMSACAGANPSGPPGLEGVTWALTGFKNTPPLAGTQPTLQLKDGQISGNAGCNPYGGSYQIQGDGIRFGDVFSTEMACQDPAGVMQQERVYLDLIRSVDRFMFAEDTITFFSGSSQILTFERRK